MPAAVGAPPWYRRLPDEAAWWQWAWTHGMRGFFEVLPDDALEEMRLQVIDELALLRTDVGVPMQQEAAFVVAAKPSD